MFLLALPYMRIVNKKMYMIFLSFLYAIIHKSSFSSICILPQHSTSRNNFFFFCLKSTQNFFCHVCVSYYIQLLFFCVVYFKSTAAVTLSHYFVIKIPICIKSNISDISNNFFLHTYIFYGTDSRRCTC
jgi:hypothetical protein